MEISNGQKVNVTIKRVIGDTPPFPEMPKVEKIVVEGTVSGVFQEDWCSIYDANGSHAIIDIRLKTNS